MKEKEKENKKEKRNEKENKQNVFEALQIHLKQLSESQISNALHNRNR